MLIKKRRRKVFKKKNLFFFNSLILIVIFIFISIVIVIVVFIIIILLIIFRSSLIMLILIFILLISQSWVIVINRYKLVRVRVLEYQRRSLHLVLISCIFHINIVSSSMSNVKIILILVIRKSRVVRKIKSCGVLVVILVNRVRVLLGIELLVI